MVLVLVLFVCGESKELEDTGTKPKGFVLLKIDCTSHVDVAEKMGRAPWFQLGSPAHFCQQALWGGFRATWKPLLLRPCPSVLSIIMPRGVAAGGIR